MWITYVVSKQRGEEIRNKFNVPLEYCGYLELYDNAVNRFNVGNAKTIRTHKESSYYITSQPMGIHMLRKISSRIANFLNLPNPELYTGHCLRRSAENTLAEANTSSTAMKQHFN